MIIEMHPDVLGAGVGLLEGEYHIRIDPQVDAVQHAPRHVPVAVLQTTLSSRIKKIIITLVTQQLTSSHTKDAYV